jgi:hypothetical protein
LSDTIFVRHFLRFGAYGKMFFTLEMWQSGRMHYLGKVANE